MRRRQDPSSHASVATADQEGPAKPPNPQNLCVLVLAWHAEDGRVTAGGFRRAVEITRRFARLGSVILLDRHPTMFWAEPGDQLEIIEYGNPTFELAAKVHPKLPRASQWLLTYYHLVRLGLAAQRETPYDVIYVPTSELLPCCLAGVTLKRLTGRPLVLCNQNVEGLFLRRLVLALHNQANGVTAVSHYLMKALRTQGVRSPIRVTLNGPTEPPEGTKHSHLEKIWDAIFIGRHTREKGIMDLLDVWEQVTWLKPGSRLLLIGECSTEMKRVINERCSRVPSLNRSVVRLGVISDKEKFRHLESARVALAPSRVEGWGFLPLEALACGVPVVCWDLPVYKESLPRTPAISRVATGDLRAFTRRVLELLECSDDDLRDMAVAVPPKSLPSWDEVSLIEWDVISQVSEASFT